jgi:hypothetical protein
MNTPAVVFDRATHLCRSLLCRSLLAQALCASHQQFQLVGRKPGPHGPCQLVGAGIALVPEPLPAGIGHGQSRQFRCQPAPGESASTAGALSSRSTDRCPSAPAREHSPPRRRRPLAPDGRSDRRAGGRRRRPRPPAPPRRGTGRRRSRSRTGAEASKIPSASGSLRSPRCRGRLPQDGRLVYRGGSRRVDDRGLVAVERACAVQAAARPNTDGTKRHRLRRPVQVALAVSHA